MEKKILLKGGSLSKTYREGNKVIKTISLTDEREYGYVRWYSQQKKMQKYVDLYPELFPKIYNIENSELEAEIQMEYMEGFKDIKTVFQQEELSLEELNKINDSIWEGFNKLHSNNFHSIDGLGNLYFQEEVVQKINDALSASEDFRNFYEFKIYNLDNNEISGFQVYKNLLSNFFKKLKLEKEELIFGNPTLENILYSFEENRSVFIDLYEESILDSKYLDYSMVLQCSNSYYGYLNDNELFVEKNYISHNLEIPTNFKNFNSLFCNKLDKKDIELIKVLEATQFFRMLPFKIKSNDLIKAKYFYVHGCKLLGEVFS
tara:strand:+ start:1854 stop:2807 length:954 start_codon:yes stop_codon:yes gene_type:complete